MENKSSRLVRVVEKFPNMITASLLWCVASLPIVTIGAANCGLYYTVNKAIIHDRGNVGREFWNAFRRDFKQATSCWVVICLLYLVFGVDCYLTFQWADSKGKSFLLCVFAGIVLLITMASLFLFPYIARFSSPTKQCVGNAVRMALWQFPKSVLLILILLLSIAVCLFFYPGMLILPGLYCVLQNKALEAVFQQIMSEEDMELEERLNADCYE